MDEISLIRAVAPDGRPSERARAAARRALEGSIRPGPTAPQRRRWTARRRVIALAGAGALATLLAAVLVLKSGPTAQPAAAEVLHDTAAVAASGEGSPALKAGPHQYYFTKTKQLELMGWYTGTYKGPGEPAYEVPGGRATRAGGFSALIPSEVEKWMSPEGRSRIRQRVDTPHFLSKTEMSQWEAMGSPLPSAFEPARQKELQRLVEDAGGREHRRIVRGVADVEFSHGGGVSEPIYPDLSGLPTNPQELRTAIQDHQLPGDPAESGEPLGDKIVAEELGALLSRPNASPALRAAAFNALGEMPGVSLDRDATDLIGRHGYAVGYPQPLGRRIEFLFDPVTSKSLGERLVLTDPGQDPVQWQGIEAGFAIRDVAYLEVGVAESIEETPSQGT